VTSPARDLLDHTTTARKIGQNVATVRDCVVQMYNDCDGGGRRFFRCPRGFVFPFNSHFFQICIWFVEVLIGRCIFRIQAAQITVGSLDPPPIYLHQQYITYLQGHIFDLEYGPGSGIRDMSEDDNINDAEEPLCNNPYYQCPYHKKHGPPSPPPLPPPPPSSMGG
jgi:hypothetical protein